MCMFIYSTAVMLKGVGLNILTSITLLEIHVSLLQLQMTCIDAS